jgi:RNA polymerase sigma-70 factor (ECF subfamily)
MDSAPISVETLLAHREWVRAVAAAVVRDPNAADDVEQETWLAALATPPRHATSLRGWFGAVARSRARRIGRSESRRDAREASAARDDRSPSAAELAELADTHRRVVQAVVELPEPYRETILLRYFEGLAVDAVAARTSVPLDTARSRISRGLAKLRERLARELGTDDRPWALALAPLIAAPRESAVGTTAAGGGVVMASTKTMAAVACALLLVGVGVVVAMNPTSSDAKTIAAETFKPSSPKKADDGAHPTPQPRRHATEDPPAPVPSNVAPPAAAPTDRTVAERLGDRVDTHELVVETAFGRLADETHVPIVLSAEAAELLAKIPRGVGRSVETRRPGAELLDSVTRGFGLAYVVEKDRVVVTPPDKKWDATRPVVVPPRPAPVADVVVLGRVTDAEGRIVVGAEIVQVLGEDIRRGVTDVAGRYEIRLRRPLGMVEARAAGQATSLAVPVKAEPGAQFTADLTLRGAAGVLRVKASSDAGPIAGATVVLAGDKVGARPVAGRPVRRTLEARTDDAGVAVFEALSAGNVAVRISAQGFEHAEGAADVVAGQAVELALKLVRPGSIKDRLASVHVSANFKDVPIRDALEYLHRVSTVNIVIDPALAGRIEARGVTLEVRDVPVAEALDAVCREIGGATYEVRQEQNIVWITADKR